MKNSAVLYVEDEENDIVLLGLAFHKARIPYPLKNAMNGEEAIDYLQGKDAFADRQRYPFPALVLLDLNLPLLPGLKVLEWIRAQPELAKLPVIIFTSSEQSADREDARQRGANDYVVKPTRIEKLAELSKTIVEKWLDDTGVAPI